MPTKMVAAWSAVTGGNFTEDLALQAMFSLLLVVSTVSSYFAGEAVNSRISMIGAENVTQYLLITRRVWAIVQTKRSFPK